MSTNKYIKGSLSADTISVLYVGSGTSITNLGVDISGKVVSGVTTTTTNLGSILYVSVSGNNATAVVGDINKPWSTLYAAKTASTSGDTIHVFPQTFTFDNRASNGMPYNGNQELINLWKNGITWFFEPNTKIKMYNQTYTGEWLYLFRPSGGTYETCTCLGYLEYEQRCEGLDTIGFTDVHSGFQIFFYGTPISADSGYTFNATVKSLWSNCSEFVFSQRTGSASATTNVTIISDEETNISDYTGTYFISSGQSGNQSFYNIRGNDSFLNFTSISNNRTILRGGGILKLTSDLGKTVINIFGETVNTLGPTLMYNAGTGTNKGLVNYNVKTTNVTENRSIYTTSGMFGGNLSTVTTGIIFNINTNLIYTTGLTLTQGIFTFTSNIGNNVINYDGNITLNTLSGAGNSIVNITTNSTIQNVINFNGDITYLGTGTTATIFKTNGGSIVNYSGKITGTFAGPVTNCLNGTININNSFIKSTTSGDTLTLIANGGTSLGTVRINNSYVELKNDTNAIGNGSYVKALINNSVIINTGSGDTLSNTTAFGSLQLLNTTIMSSGNSVNYSASPVTSMFSTTNTPYTITTLNGSLATTTEITY